MSTDMNKSLFRPCIDLHDGLVKQIIGGTLEDSGGGLRTNFVAGQDAGYFADLYRRDNLTGGHVIKLGPGNDDAARLALRHFPNGMQLGGGVTDANAADWLACGAAKVIVTSFVFYDGELDMRRLEKLTAAIGREHLTLDLSCRKTADGKYLVVTDRWSKFTRCEAGETLFLQLRDFASEFLIHAVDVEGRRCGLDCELLRKLAAESPIECVYAGGIASFEDIETVEQVGEGRIGYTVGSALDIFGGGLSYRELAGRVRQRS